MATKEVFFFAYCERCEFSELPAHEDPCDLCLANPANEDSHKPLYFKEMETKDK